MPGRTWKHTNYFIKTSLITRIFLFLAIIINFMIVFKKNSPLEQNKGEQIGLIQTSQ